MTLKSNAKFKENIARGLKNDMRNFVSFHESSQKSENLYFDGLLLSKAYKDLYEKVQKNCLMTMMRSLKKNWLLAPKNKMMNLENFNASSGKSVNVHFFGLLLQKICNVWAKKIQKSGIVKNDLWFQKWNTKFVEFWDK